MKRVEFLERIKELGLTVNLERKDGSKIEPYDGKGSKLDRLNYYREKYSNPPNGETVNDIG